MYPRALFIVVLVWLAAGRLMAAQGPDKTPWPCPSKPVEPCVKQHGRLSSQNGIALKIWLVGTTRIIGLENDVADLPQVIGRYLEMTSPNHSYIFGDFEICPTQPDRPGRMRLACAAGVERVVVQPLRDSRPPFRVLSTWPAGARVSARDKDGRPGLR